MKSERLVSVGYPGCWYWVDETFNPIRRDPDSPAEQIDAAAYRSLDWTAIGGAVRTAVQLAGPAWNPSERETQVVLQAELGDDEWEIVEDWLWTRPPTTSPLKLNDRPPVTDGQHRLWLAGETGNFPLPVLSEELSDAAWQFGLDPIYGVADYQTPLRQLKELTGWWNSAGDASLASINGEHLIAVREASRWLEGNLRA